MGLRSRLQNLVATPELTMSTGVKPKSLEQRLKTILKDVSVSHPRFREQTEH